ncbi:patatin-like phospholipase family protein [Bacteroides sp. GD17]|jgi:NTE family protein|uniref:patatin-like phospholipase family protein n=1 Tax=Bacteroides sp. GD17 TaxID=3139826 RepID=UPI0025D3809D|nr:patatin-like phospholipase family protein [uncultured Bacteroides sp.]
MRYRFLACLFLFPMLLWAQNRPKVAVVLSGGGAKGTAHIGALKVIEEAGIPVDYVVGTSMGAIVGGLYAIGYTPQQLDSMVNAQNWKFLLSDAPNPKNLLLDDRLRSERYVLSIPFSFKSATVSDAGIIKGTNLARLFSVLTDGYQDSVSFSRLPIPFACVSENLVNGSEVVFHQGILATAMRSSMSIPGVFAPIDLNGMVLVDGGMVNNYPVDVALAMGADFVIGVDVQSPLLDASGLKSVKDIFGQIINLQGEKKYQENLRKTDVHIKVDVTGYSAASFTKEAIDTLIVRGEHAAKADWDKLLALKKKLGLSADYQPRRPGPFPIPDAVESEAIAVDPQIAAPAVRENKLNVGLRFDTEELAALQANTDFYLGKRKDSQISLTARLGKRTSAQLGYNYQWSRGWQTGLAYQFDYKDINIYNEGKRTLDLTFTHQLVRAGVAKDWNQVQVSAGIDFDYYRYHDLLSLEPLDAVMFKNGALFSYYAGLLFNSLNGRSVPTKGMSWAVTYNLYTDNLLRYKDHNPVSAFSAHWQGCFTPTRDFTIIPSIDGRVLAGGKDDYTFAVSNLLGGSIAGRYMPQQIPFVGINRAELASGTLIVTGLQLRQRILKNQYILVTGNYGRSSGKLHELFEASQSSDLVGTGVGYMYNSFLGPLEVQLNWSNQTKKLGWYAGFGFVF